MKKQKTVGWVVVIDGADVTIDLGLVYPTREDARDVAQALNDENRIAGFPFHAFIARVMRE